MKRLIIRADASPQIGAGHIMRCLALAQTWQDGGGHVAFLSRCESAALRQRLTGEGFDLIPLENSHPHRDDLRNTLAYLEHSAVEAGSAAAAWVVLDGYHFGATYQKALKQAGVRLLCIDDYGHAAHYSADLVLNQNISANEALYPNREPSTQLLLGTRYVLLRREFRSWRGWKRTIPEVARKVLVTMGGGDPHNVTLKVVEALKVIGDPQLEIQIVVGPENQNLDILESAVLEAPGPMRLLKDVTDMPALMAWADIAVSAGGSTCWELAFMELPAITLALADNQRPIADLLHKRGIVTNLGWHESVTVGQLAATLAPVLRSRDQRLGMSGAGRALVDGEGTDRICMLLEGR
jgi:UDP-2,4-diacetamido-2,4,6-trideoxy-beta-L-altropyranose hydrolase